MGILFPLLKMECEICGMRIRVVNNAYVCDEGHTLENKVEVADDVHASAVIRAPREEKIIASAISINPAYTRLFLAHLMFEDVRIRLEIRSSKYFEIFANLCTDRGPTLEGPEVSFSTVMALAYYTKRIEAEAQDRTYLYLEFSQAMENYPLLETVAEKLSILGQRPADHRTFHKTHMGYGMSLIEKLLRCMGQAGVELQRNPKNVMYNETGILDDALENTRACFRQDLRRDLPMMTQYLVRICSILALDITDNLERSFAVFFYASDFSRTIHIPDTEIAAFLYIYIMNRRRDLDIAGAMNSVKNTFFESFHKIIGKQSASAPETFRTFATPRAFQENLKILMRTVSWQRICAFNIKVSETKRLIKSTRSVDALRRHRRLLDSLPTANFVRAVWLVKKLMVQKRQ